MKMLHAGTTRNLWLKAIYENGLVTANSETAAYADKLYLFRKISSEMGAEMAQIFHPKTMGFAEMLNNTFGDNHWQTPFEAALPALLERLNKEFPRGFIVKPTTIINTGGETAGYWFFMDQFAEDWKNGHALLRANYMRQQDYASPLLGRKISNEELCFQESIFGIADKEPHLAKSYPEIRVHTYENQVVAGATYSRWAVNPVRSNPQFMRAESFVAEFLKHFSESFLDSQAWALDVMVIDHVARIVDINTNRGECAQWSGFLSRPGVLRAYTRHFEKHKNVRFSGISGTILRYHMGNLFKNFKKRYIEGIR